MGGGGGATVEEMVDRSGDEKCLRLVSLKLIQCVRIK